MAYKIDLTNQKFGNLTVIKYIGQRGRRRTFWLCKCDCGNIVEIDGDHLKSGHTNLAGAYLEIKLNFSIIKQANQSRNYIVLTEIC